VKAGKANPISTVTAKTADAAAHRADNGAGQGGDRTGFDVADRRSPGADDVLHAGYPAAELIRRHGLHDRSTEHHGERIGRPGHGERRQGRGQSAGQAEAGNGQAPDHRAGQHAAALPGHPPDRA